MEKDTSEFYSKIRYRKYPSGLSSYSHECKDCVKASRAEYIKANPDKRYLADRKQHLKRYGLTIEDYNVLFAKQGGCCAGCKYHQTEFNRNFAVDHDHLTGKVRGLLCVGCNLILGYAEDRQETLSNLIKYLSLNNSELADYNSNVVEVKFPKKAG